jgi:hypothetical protein
LAKLTLFILHIFAIDNELSKYVKQFLVLTTKRLGSGSCLVEGLEGELYEPLLQEDGRALQVVSPPSASIQSERW